MPDKTVKLRLKVKDRKRLRRLAAAAGIEDRQVIEQALKALERARKTVPPAAADVMETPAQPSPGRFRIRCEIEGADTAEALEQLQGLVNEIAGWLQIRGVAEEALPMMLVALGAQCIREGERSQRFLDEREANVEE